MVIDSWKTAYYVVTEKKHDTNSALYCIPQYRFNCNNCAIEVHKTTKA